MISSSQPTIMHNLAENAAMLYNALKQPEYGANSPRVGDGAFSSQMFMPSFPYMGSCYSPQPIQVQSASVHPGMESFPIVGISYYGNYIIPTYLVPQTFDASQNNASNIVPPAAPQTPNEGGLSGSESVSSSNILASPLVSPTEPKEKCTENNCKKKAVEGTKLCYAHGGRMRCQQKGCTKAARGCYKFCRAHGGGPRCTVPECTKSAIDASRLCRGHGGGPRCQFEGCKKSAAGAPPVFCISHGGGRRCSVAGCTKSAQRATKKCIAHGGGKRCAAPTCSKSAQGGTNYCKAHGGGKKCKFLRCGKVATMENGFCRLHATAMTLREAI